MKTVFALVMLVALAGCGRKEAPPQFHLYGPSTGRASGAWSNPPFNGDKHADVVVAPNTGFSPEVKVISGLDGTTILTDQTSLFPTKGTYRQGVRVATGDQDWPG